MINTVHSKHAYWHVPNVVFHIFLNFLQISDRNLSYEIEHSYWRLSININNNLQKQRKYADRNAA